MIRAMSSRSALLGGAVLLIAGCHGAAAPAVVPVSPVAPSPAQVAAEPETTLTEIARLLTPDPADGWNPRRLWLTAFRDDGERVTLTCQAHDGEDVSQLLRRLTKSTWFEDVVLGTATRDTLDDAALIDVTITARSTRAHAPQTANATDPPAAFWAGRRNPFEKLAAVTHDRLANAGPTYALSLLGIIDGPEPRAMFSDAEKRSVIVKVGTPIGSGDPGEACRWRVAAIEPSTVSLVRDVPSKCAALPAKRVFHLTP